MRLFFAYWLLGDGGSTQDIRAYVTTARELGHEVGRLGSGLVLALPGLNDILRKLGRPVLDDAELRALASAEAVKRFSLAACRPRSCARPPTSATRATCSASTNGA